MNILGSIHSGENLVSKFNLVNYTLKYEYPTKLKSFVTWTYIIWDRFLNTSMAVSLQQGSKLKTVTSDTKESVRELRRRMHLVKG